MSNLENMNAKELIEKLDEVLLEYSKEKALNNDVDNEKTKKLIGEADEILQKISANNNSIDLQEIKEKIEEAFRNKNQEDYEKYDDLLKEKSIYNEFFVSDRYEKLVKGDIKGYLGINQPTKEETETVEKEPKSLKQRFFKTAKVVGLVAALAATVYAFKSCHGMNSANSDEPTATSTPNPGNNEYNQEQSDELIQEMEDKARDYYEEYSEYYSKNDETKHITEQDIINIAYLINDREDLLSSEDLEDAMNNIELGVGYEPSMLLSITSQLANNSTIKANLSESKYAKYEEQLQKDINNFKPARLSDLVVTNKSELANVKAMEKCFEDIVNGAKKTGKITQTSKTKYNNLLVELHYNNAYKNGTSVSDNTENNSNLGFKYYVMSTVYAFYDVGTTINPNKTTVSNVEMFDPITGKYADVQLTTHNEDELNTMNRIASGEKSKKLQEKYTKIKNKLPVLRYKDDVCAMRLKLEEQVYNYTLADGKKLKLEQNN